ncbi:MAG TPA: hypothetical protein VK142_11160 [Bacillota bacterium]|nr:hypothetical protein [Bacillota bacterium]
MSGTTIIILSLLGVIFLITVIVLMGDTQVQKAKAKSEKGEAYQKQAADAIEVQRETAQLNEKLAADMGEVKERLASIERILKEVE